MSAHDVRFDLPRRFGRGWMDGWAGRVRLIGDGEISTSEILRIRIKLGGTWLSHRQGSI